MTAPRRAEGEPETNLERLERSLLLDFGRCCKDFGLIGHRDRVMACLSGGKDSFTMLHLLRRMQRRTPFVFDVFAVTVDLGQPAFDPEPIEEFARAQGVELRIVEQEVFSVMREKVPQGKSLCSFCARIRRGVLYRIAKETGATKIALGHHREDVVETLMLNLLYSGQTKAMPPRLVSDDGEHVVIRPMAYLAEDDIERFAAARGMRTSTCQGCGKDDPHRRKIKLLLQELSAENPKVKGNLLAALSTVLPSHLLDRELLASLGRPVPSVQKGRTRHSYEEEAEGSTPNEVL
ncbi:MAG: tRNA 2-thiocytidine(32) synthetase TtcA [Myxococcota bacterium]